jgi:hypothetical protein
VERNPEHDAGHPGAVEPPAGPLQGIGLESSNGAGDKRKRWEEQEANGTKDGLTGCMLRKCLEDEDAKGTRDGPSDRWIQGFLPISASFAVLVLLQCARGNGHRRRFIEMTS